MRARGAALSRWLCAAAVCAVGVPSFAPAQSSGPRVVAPLCIGACPRVAGVRLAWRDRAGVRADGLNITIWFPHDEGTGKTNGIALGLPISSSGDADGLVIGPLAAQTTDRLRGIGVAGFAMGADRLTGALASGLLTLAGESRGVAVSGVATIATVSTKGIAVGGAGVFAGGGWGVAAGGLAVHAGGGFRGVVASGLGIFSGVTTGIAVTGGVHKANDFRGLSLALVNYARSLRGLQIGAINIVADGRSPRLLPLVNWR